MRCSGPLRTGGSARTAGSRGTSRRTGPGRSPGGRSSRHVSHRGHRLRPGALVAAALPDGARVLVPDIEFTSNLFPWLAHADRGVEVATVPLERLAEPSTPHYAGRVQRRCSPRPGSSPTWPRSRRRPARRCAGRGGRHPGLRLAAGRGPYVDALACTLQVADVAARHGVPRSGALRDRMRPSRPAGTPGPTSTRPTTGGRATGRRRPPLRHLTRLVRWVGTAPALELIEQIGVDVIIPRRRAGQPVRAGLGLPPGVGDRVDRLPGAAAELDGQASGPRPRWRAAGLVPRVPPGRRRRGRGCAGRLTGQVRTGRCKVLECDESERSS